MAGQGGISLTFFRATFLALFVLGTCVVFKPSGSDFSSRGASHRGLLESAPLQAAAIDVPPVRTSLPLGSAMTIIGSPSSSLQDSVDNMQLDNETHSQFGEDRWLWNNAFFQKSNGLFLEMGALDGLKLSNTFWFEKHANWSGLLIEASTASYNSLINNRPQAVCLNAAVCQDYRTIHFVGSSASTPVSGIYEFLSESLRQRYWSKVDVSRLPQIPCVPLMYLLERVGMFHFDLWSLDVEGAELQVLQTVDFSRFSASVIVVEINNDADQIMDLLERNGYVRQEVTGQAAAHRNLFYVHRSYLTKLSKQAL